jgi:hypothetical protein
VQAFFAKKVKKVEKKFFGPLFFGTTAVFENKLATSQTSKHV